MSNWSRSMPHNLPSSLVSSKHGTTHTSDIKAFMKINKSTERITTRPTGTSQHWGRINRSSNVPTPIVGPVGVNSTNSARRSAQHRSISAARTPQVVSLAGRTNDKAISDSVSSKSSLDTEKTSNRDEGRKSRATYRDGNDRRRSASQGLRNLGNTCYMNSILQCLAKLPWFVKTVGGSKVYKDELLKEFFNLMQKMALNESDETIDPSRFRNQLGLQFSSSEQNDAHEFLLCLLSRLSKSLEKEPGERNIVKDLLFGEIETITNFKPCGHVCRNTQGFFAISLPITEQSHWTKPSIVNLTDCIHNYKKEQDLEGDVLCLDCNNQQPNTNMSRHSHRKADGKQKRCTLNTVFKRFPPYLIFHLKRYDIQRMEKLDTKIKFPVDNLKLEKDMGNDDTKAEFHKSTEKTMVSYTLFAACNHYGSLRFGHYTADIKSTNNWYNYSDSRVIPSNLLSGSPSRDVYLLFYERVPTSMESSV